MVGTPSQWSHVERIKGSLFAVTCHKNLNWKFHVVDWQATPKNSTEVRAARAARLFFLV